MDLVSTKDVSTSFCICIAADDIRAIAPEKPLFVQKNCRKIQKVYSWHAPFETEEEEVKLRRWVPYNVIIKNKKKQCVKIKLKLPEIKR